MTSTTINARVHRGAALLDEKFPGWESSVNVSTLNLESSCNCVLGQKFGDFVVGSQKIGFTDYAGTAPLPDYGREQLESHGFLATVHRFELLPGYVRISDKELERIEAEYVALTEAWRELIVDRRAATQLAEVEERVLVQA
jgi:hypothetical protein